jgi:hypothetical protein
MTRLGGPEDFARYIVARRPDLAAWVDTPSGQAALRQAMAREVRHGGPGAFHAAAVGALLAWDAGDVDRFQRLTTTASAEAMGLGGVEGDEALLLRQVRHCANLLGAAQRLETLGFTRQVLVRQRYGQGLHSDPRLVERHPDGREVEIRCAPILLVLPESYHVIRRATGPMGREEWTDATVFELAAAVNAAAREA